MSDTPPTNTDYSKDYSEESFWDKIKTSFDKIGRPLLEKVLTLYYVLIDSSTPAWAKALIIPALGYFIFPLDVIPDIIPVFGYGDDLGVIVGVLAAVTTCVTEKHNKQAQTKLADWFGK
jgi:uncharacterized membrane protein YkvA (DUF1232 family)